MDPSEGPYPNRGSCVFAQTSVMRSGASRDGRRQSRLLRGTSKGFEICTVDHKKKGKVRIDATISYRDDSHGKEILICMIDLTNSQLNNLLFVSVSRGWNIHA